MLLGDLNRASAAKFLGVRSSIIHHRNHNRASNRGASLIKDSARSSAVCSIEPEQRSRWRRAHRARTEAIYRSFAAKNRGCARYKLDSPRPRNILRPRRAISRDEPSEIIPPADGVFHGNGECRRRMNANIRSLRRKSVVGFDVD